MIFGVNTFRTDTVELTILVYVIDWEQRKLGEMLGSFEYGINASAKKYDGHNKYLRITDIDDTSHKLLRDNLTTPNIDIGEVSKYKLKTGDIVFARTGASVGKTYIYNDNDGNVYYAGYLIRGEIKDNFNAEFIFQNTLTDKYANFIRITSQRSGQPGVNVKEYSNYKLFAPKFQDQNKIGLLLNKLDNTVALQQRMLKQLNTLKKAMLQKMFADQNYHKPELRFNGFSEDWEQRKLEKIFKERKEKSGSKALLSVSINNGVTPFNESGRKNNSSKDKHNYRVVKPGDIAYNSMRMWQGALGVSNLEGIVSPAYTVITPTKNEDPYFYYYMFKKQSSLNIFQRNSQGLTSDTWNLKFPLLKLISFYTTNTEEQMKIAKLLLSVDKTITLQQKKLNNLNSLKEFLLQTMFI